MQLALGLESSTVKDSPLEVSTTTVVGFVVYVDFAHSLSIPIVGLSRVYWGHISFATAGAALNCKL